MDRISQDSYFHPEQAGVICVAVDKHGHYLPSPANALRFLQQEDTEDGIRLFLDDNVKAVSCLTYVPDVTMLVFRFRNMKDIPFPKAEQTTDRYIHDSLFPYLTSRDLLPEKTISLADAVYASRTRGTPDCSALKRYFMQESGYLDFLTEQRDRKNIYHQQPEYVLPLTVVKNNFGYLFFSGNEVGKKGFKACIQHMADHYFDPHYDMGKLDIYECSSLNEKLLRHIDTAYAPHRYLPVNGFDFSPRRYVAPSCLPDGMTGLLKPVYNHPLHPDADSFACFALHFREDERTRTVISRQNNDIYRLLTIKRNGYMNVHEKPFTYFKALLPVAKKLEQAARVRPGKGFDAENFRIFSLTIGRQAEAILHRDFDVRGHRSIVNLLDDDSLTFTVGRVKLNSVQRAVLADGHAVHLPENDCREYSRQLYCMIDRFGNCLKTSDKPFPDVQTYRMANGLIHRVETEPNKKVREKESKKQRNTHKM